MLLHLKEPDYQKDAPQDIPARFYARNPQHILNTIRWYKDRENIVGDEPNLVWWLRKSFSEKDIEQVERGLFYFFTGMISLAKKDEDKPLFEEIKINDEFKIYVPEENIGHFALYRQNLAGTKRGDLYKLQCNSALFPNISFVPKDIVKDIISHDLRKYANSIKKDIERRRELSQHHNIKVDGLEQILKAKERSVKQ